MGKHLNFHQKAYAEQPPDIIIPRGRLSNGEEAFTDKEHEAYIGGPGQIGWMAIVSCAYLAFEYII